MNGVDVAAGAIRESETVALACHVGPDGDALGSMLGLGLAAANAGKSVVASFGSPFAVPDNLSFLPTEALVPPGEFPESPELMIVLDAGSQDRLGDLAPHAGRAGTLIVIDHHVTNEGFGHISLVDPAAAATAEIVLRVLDLLGWPVTSEIATCLHTAIVTDTGRFQYANTTPSTFQTAARLLEAGALPSEISRHVYEEAPFGYLRAAASALARADLDEDLSLVSCVITGEDLASAGVDWGDIDNLIDLVRMAEEADTAALLKVHEADRVKVSLRSRGKTDVGSLAAALGGGGHRLAAGFTYSGAADRALAEIKRLIGEHR